MRYFKLPDDKKILTVNDDNLVNLYVREGFIEVDKKGEPIKEESTEEE